MNMIDAPTLLTIIFVLVDDWYRQSPFSRVLANHPGRQANFSRRVDFSAGSCLVHFT